MIAGGSIGLITLIAAMCSIFNTVLASVERRTREIGILRALGASTSGVLTMFLLEGVIVALSGGTIACGMLYFLTDTANSIVLDRLMRNVELKHLVELNPALFVFPQWLGLSVIGVGVVAALLASLFPALAAARIRPAAALRHT